VRGRFPGPVWPPWGRGRFPGPRAATVEAWPVPWAPCGRCGDVAGSLGPVWPFRKHGLSLRPMWPPWGRGQFPGHVSPWVVARLLGPVWPPWGVAGSLCPVLPPRVCGLSCGPCVAAMGAWPIPWAPCGRRGCVDGPLGLVCSPWGVAGILGQVWPPLERVSSPGSCMAAMEAWWVPWAPYGFRGGVADSLGLVRLPLLRGPSPGPHVADVGM